MRFGSPIWMAASPMPGASYMVSNMSSTSLRVAASILATGLETSRNRLSGKIRMSRTAMGRDLRAGLRHGQCVLYLFFRRESRPPVAPSESRKTRSWKPRCSIALGLARGPRHRGPCRVRRRPRSAERPVRAEPPPRRSLPTSASSSWARGSRPWANCSPGRRRQLQSSVNERLDAVTQHLGTSMQTATKHTTENLQKLNERLAVIDNAQKNLTDLDLAGHLAARRAGQQADPRRVRPGPHGGDHPGRPAEGRLRIPVHAEERQAARTAWCCCPTSGRW